MSEQKWYIVAEDGFEGEFPAFGGVSELQAAEGWDAVWIEDPQDGVLDRPEFKPAGADQVLFGKGTQAIHGAFSTISGAIYRRFPTIVGQQYYAEVWAMGLTDMGADGQPMMGMVIEIDVSGGTDFGGPYPQVSSEWWSQDRREWENGGWEPLKTAPFTAQADYITVYLKTESRFAYRSHAHFDEFRLFGTDPGGGGGDSGEVAAELLTIADAQLALSMKIRTLASRVGGGSIEAKALIEQAEEILAEAKTML